MSTTNQAQEVILNTSYSQEVAFDDEQKRAIEVSKHVQRAKLVISATGYLGDRAHTLMKVGRDRATGHTVEGIVNLERHRHPPGIEQVSERAKQLIQQVVNQNQDQEVREHEALQGQVNQRIAKEILRPIRGRKGLVQRVGENLFGS